MNKRQVCSDAQRDKNAVVVHLFVYEMGAIFVHMQKNCGRARENPAEAVGAGGAMERIVRRRASAKFQQKMKMNGGSNDREQRGRRLLDAPPLRVAGFSCADAGWGVQHGGREAIEEAYLAHAEIWIGVDRGGCKRRCAQQYKND